MVDNIARPVSGRPRDRLRHRPRLLAMSAVLSLTSCAGVQPVDQDRLAPASAPASTESAREGSEVSPTVSSDNTTAHSVATPVPTTTFPPGIYVDAANGRNGATGSPDDPFLTPVEAMRSLRPGDTLFFRGGTYDDRVTGTITGTLIGTKEDPITLRPYLDEEVTITAGGEWGDGIDLRGSSFVIVEGFTMRGRDDSIHGSGVRARDDSHDIVIRHNYIENFGLTGVAGARAGRLTIEYNEIRHNARRSFYQGSGISMWEATGPGDEGDEFANIIRGNLVAENYTEAVSPGGTITDGNCIIIDFFNTVGYTGSTLIENNTCINNGGRGIHILESSNVAVRNNTLVKNGWTPELTYGRAELSAAWAYDITFTNNLVVNNPDVPAFHVRPGSTVTISYNAQSNGDLPPGQANMLLQPTDETLVSFDPKGKAGDHRPSPNSPVVGAAQPATQSPFDGCGRARPATGSIGAFEPASGAQVPPC